MANNALEAMRREVTQTLKALIREHGPRRSGSKSCNACSESLHAHAQNFADAVSREHFYVHSGAFLGWIRILVVCYLAGVAFMWANLPLIAIGLSAFGILLMIFQFFFYLPVLDPFFRKRDAHNVIATVEPQKEATKHVLITGHHDSARIFNFFIHQPTLYALRVNGSIVFMLLLLLFSLFGLFVSGANDLYLLMRIILSLGVLLVAQMWFFASKKATPGAGDNLASSLLAFGIAKHFKAHPLKNTRISAISFDAEEEGLRGARAYVKKHKKALHQLPTHVINLECLYDEKALSLLTSDINGFVKLDTPLATTLSKHASQNGFNVPLKPLAFLTGGTDAGMFGRINIPATTLFGMKWSNAARDAGYHTMEDTPKRVSKRALDIASKTIVDTIEAYDKQTKK